MVHIYTTGKTINPFAIVYMIKPSLKFNNAFRIQVEKCLSLSFVATTMETIKECMRKKNTYVMTLLMIYQNNE